MFADVGGTEHFDERVAGMYSALADGWSVADDVRPNLMTAVGHAMSFDTWKSLTQGGITDDLARDMMVGFVMGIAATGS
jgi:predicted acyltransferase